MMTLISANWPFFLIALGLGVATAFWVWAASGGEATDADQFDGDDGLLEKAGEPVPSVSPEPAAAEPEPEPAPAPAPAPKAEPEPAPAASEPAEPTPTPKPRTKPAPTTEVTPPPTGSKPTIPAAVGEPDNLRLIKGVGPKLNALLNELGITRYDQIAAWKEAEIAEVDKYLDNFSGRIQRDAWIDQAKFLAKDDIAGFEKKYGKL